MRLINAGKIRWRLNKGNVRGRLGVKPLLVGDPDSPENYLCNIARSEGDYVSPRHRHNFDQIRLVLEGESDIGKGRTIKPGQIGYFPEGTYYGPQNDSGRGWTIWIVQFGGASGEGFTSAARALVTCAPIYLQFAESPWG